MGSGSGLAAHTELVCGRKYTELDRVDALNLLQFYLSYSL